MNLDTPSLTLPLGLRLFARCTAERGRESAGRHNCLYTQNCPRAGIGSDGGLAAKGSFCG